MTCRWLVGCWLTSTAEVAAIFVPLSRIGQEVPGNRGVFPCLARYAYRSMVSRIKVTARAILWIHNLPAVLSTGCHVTTESATRTRLTQYQDDGIGPQPTALRS